MHGWKILLSYRRLHDYAEDDSWPSVKHELTKHLNSPTGGIDDDMFELHVCLQMCSPQTCHIQGTQPTHGDSPRMQAATPWQAEHLHVCLAFQTPAAMRRRMNLRATEARFTTIEGLRGRIHTEVMKMMTMTAVLQIPVQVVRQASAERT